MSNAIRKICNTVLSVVLICSGAAGTALGAEEFPSSEGLFVSTLKLNLTQADRNGDSRAKENLRVLQSLDARDLQKLESILEWGPEFSQLPSDSEVAPKLLDDGIVNHEVTTYAFQGSTLKWGALLGSLLELVLPKCVPGGRTGPATVLRLVLMTLEPMLRTIISLFLIFAWRMPTVGYQAVLLGLRARLQLCAVRFQDWGGIFQRIRVFIL